VADAVRGASRSSVDQSLMDRLLELPSLRHARECVWVGYPAYMVLLQPTPLFHEHKTHTHKN
jgi:hypothetical protein